MTGQSAQTRGDQLIDGIRASVDGAALLDELHESLTRYVVLPSEGAGHAVTLWIAATHAQPAFEHAPRLAILSPEKRCGKSRLLDVCAETCHDVLITTNATIAAVVRSIGADPPTLLVDEADALFGTKKAAENNEDLRALLNAGHQRNRHVLRCVGPQQIPKAFPTFAMAALAAIGDLPDTVMDRSIVVRMRRRGPGESVEPFRQRRDAPALRDLRRRLAEWARLHVEELTGAEPKMPLEDRAADTWEPLFAVAELAGGPWPERAAAAAAGIVAVQEDDDGETLHRRLLADLRACFSGDGEEKLPTETILVQLHAVEDGPWRTLDGRGIDGASAGLDAGQLARFLRRYRVKPSQWRVDGKPRRGYLRAELVDTWERYLPPRNVAEDDEQPDSGRDPVTPVTAVTSQVSASRGRDASRVPRDAPVPRDASTRDVTGVTGVTGSRPSVDADLTERGICEVCGQPMLIVEPGQTAHPTCSDRVPAAANGRAWWTR